MSLTLYLSPPSGNSYKVRILLEQLELPYAMKFVDTSRNEHKSEAFRNRYNPRGQLPVLQDDDNIVWDSAACLVYLARRENRLDWLPVEPRSMAEVMQWLAMAGTELQFGLQYARRGVTSGRWIAGTLDQLQAIGRLGLEALEWRLEGHEWLALDHITVADIACFPYVETAHEAQIDLSAYPAVAAWMERCRSIPRWAKRLPKEAPEPTISARGR
jgi:glutathione S-transferase